MKHCEVSMMSFDFLKTYDVCFEHELAIIIEVCGVFLSKCTEAIDIETDYFPEIKG